MLYSSTTGFLSKKYGIETAVKMLVDAGYTGIDCSMFNLNDLPFANGCKQTAEKLLAITEPRGVKFNQAHAPFTSNPEVYRGELVPLFPQVFEFASLLGIKNLIVHPFQDGRFYGREEEIFAKNVEFYKSLIPLAKKHGIRMAIENMWQRHPVTHRICDDICADPEQLVRLYDTLNDPETFTICLDLGHVALCGREPDEVIRYIGKKIGCLHVHDVDYIDDLHTLPGVSKIKWDKVCAALADIGYEGDITLEADNFFLGFFPEMYPQAARYMRDTAKSLVDRIEELKA